jgi:putative hydrolase of the HAD superfamily
MKFDLSGFKAVLFDLDSTLIDTENYALRASAWILSQCTDEPDDLLGPYLRTLVKHYRDETYRIADGFPYISPHECVKNAIQTTIEEMNFDAEPSLPERGADLFKRLHLELSKPYPGVERLLDLLKSKNLKLGVLTNSFEGHSKIILDRFNLRYFFDSVLDGSDVKSYKPQPEPFNYALNTLNVKAKESLFIGDEFVADIVGAFSLGMTVVWINTRYQKLEELQNKHGPNVIPALVLPSLSEFANYL